MQCELPTVIQLLLLTLIWFKQREKKGVDYIFQNVIHMGYVTKKGSSNNLGSLI